MASLLRRLLRDPKTCIDDRLWSEVGGDILKKYVVSEKILPAYRFVDLYRAIERLTEKCDKVRRIESENEEDLNSLLHGRRPHWTWREITRSERTAWPVGAKEEVFLPVDHYWIYAAGEATGAGHVIVRLKYEPFNEQAKIAVAGHSAAYVDKRIAEFIQESARESIYRNQLLSIAFESGTKDEYGDMEKAERLRISFKVATPVPDEDFVVNEEIYKAIWRNVIDLHQRRKLLKSHGVPIRRGVLMYGPPGTGKTFACRYICGKLPDTTRIVVAGTALQRVPHVFEFARTYQPSIVILEDVDLVFTARDMTLQGSQLGDLLDQMDGLRPFEDVGVILTTNSIERMEAAIKDRPGRISQCIYFGPPVDELRRRYLAQYSKGYDLSAVDTEQLIKISEGTTPAFIKEWVHRTVQIATERLKDENSELKLTTDDFREAHGEMRRFTEGSTRRIIGFIGPEENS